MLYSACTVQPIISLAIRPNVSLNASTAAGEAPRNKKYRFHDFVLSYSGE